MPAGTMVVLGVDRVLGVEEYSRRVRESGVSGVSKYIGETLAVVG